MFPRSLNEYWNWKSAVVSSLIRAGIFFAANLNRGRAAAVAALTTELVYRIIASGFFGAMTQRLSRVEPVWRGVLYAFFVLPAAQHSVEFLIHWLRGTPNLGISVGLSVLFTGVSTLINLQLMRKGVLTAGIGSKTLVQDLAALPRLCWSAARTLAARAGSRSRESEI
jgi:hypothetical protein